MMGFSYLPNDHGSSLGFTLVYLWCLSYSLLRPSCPIDSDSSRLPPQRLGLEVRVRLGRVATLRNQDTKRHSRNYYDSLAFCMYSCPGVLITNYRLSLD
ncbi:uncharacterized protein F5891DRAFT_994161 [Suillus fuscotomentosus]|uniref:Uncharacterized protein n=1 Tax=Suillus fuscotomentosus TaxID=1912939 RepID=A0AAD4HSL9_9AGAM|nr:uncharacterized protein F5891DRAFT_994161 [Suillus fuscotomentosus]KAG1908610.1 hypothetical protein F5891DRAFT_994161 [Suillus fuscotomentosus]